MTLVATEAIMSLRDTTHQPAGDQSMLSKTQSSYRFPGSIQVGKTGLTLATVREVHPDSRGYLLIKVLLSGYALRCMNHIRVTVDGGLNAALILYHLLDTERESLFALGLHSGVPVPDAPQPGRARSRPLPTRPHCRASRCDASWSGWPPPAGSRRLVRPGTARPIAPAIGLPWQTMPA